MLNFKFQISNFSNSLTFFYSCNWLKLFVVYFYTFCWAMQSDNHIMQILYVGNCNTIRVKMKCALTHSYEIFQCRRKLSLMKDSCWYHIFFSNVFLLNMFFSCSPKYKGFLMFQFRIWFSKYLKDFIQYVRNI